MCGIFGIVHDKSNHAAQTVLSGLKKLEYRGYDSWGIAVKPIASSSLLVEKHVGKIGSANTSLPSGTIAIGHTRWATHGGVTDVNAHPHTDCDNKIAVIHNGIVENYQELKLLLVAKKHRFISETDTEVIAHLVEEEAKNKPIELAVFAAFNRLVGSNAITVLDYASEQIIACRNGSPLVVGFGKKETYLASDSTAFLDKTNRVYFLQDNEAVVLGASDASLYTLPRVNKIKLHIQQLDWQIDAAEKQGYPHFLLKEIMEQQKTIPHAVETNAKQVQVLGGMINQGFSPIFLGCGTASYCGLAGSYFFASKHIRSVNIGAYEFSPFLPFINKNSLVFAISQSGETADTLIAVKEAKRKGATIASVINARGSTLERLSDVVLSVGAGPEIAVVSTKAYTAQLALLYAIALYTNKKNDLLPLDLTSWLTEKLQEDIITIAKTMMDQEHAYIIGKYINYPAALEFALKLKETSYMHAEAFAAGELKHGVITLIQKGTPCIVLADSGSSFAEIRSSAAQLKARGGHIIGISPQQAPEFDGWIKTPHTPSEYSIFYNVIVGQLLGYYLGVGRGADPDKPRNLAKSVTVK